MSSVASRVVRLETPRRERFRGVGFATFVPEVAAQPEIGWRLAREFWGQGYATEAAIAARWVLVDYQFDRADWHAA